MRKKIGIMVMIAICLLCVASAAAAEQAMAMNTAVKDFADKAGIDFGKSYGVTNMFVESVSFGGAGGMANFQLEYRSSQDFLREVQKLNCTRIRYFDASEMCRPYNTCDCADCIVRREYYAFDSENSTTGTVVYYKETYVLPKGTVLKNVTYEQIIYEAGPEKTPGFPIYDALFALVTLGAVLAGWRRAD